jgi:hypothetical protein
MKGRPPKLGRFLASWLWVALGCLLLAGCATTESENLSERPWNAPKSWEHGLPASMFEGK